ncbi:hypothetical protein PF005_g26633 [Phytophthora fragariae]|uniref:Uncharacterized protein n=1 Tax=Phytophthora fragariae TaxID=53985 RepID=A0A6A3RFN8_9STRA|nr:hypothetical protein PF003_g24559 [Phytophthora fragariae]KAE8922272.1 hypothetical protein PF009_g27463 [Phytophthora fragariae]KAE8982488.1 hypothetical protein PF011_g21595 [Phytophthora fragariae]KAE9075063.1 hypothetical protein PF010_g24462 [Phytophthora fragariae]KAE9086442.1 hypothetical protein PF006_g26030 [Phytophthora fragariae]
MVVTAADASIELRTTSLDPKVADTVAKRAILPVTTADLSASSGFRQPSLE